MSTEQNARQAPCPKCGGTGGDYITVEMASDAGSPQMAGQFWGCSYCNGDGWILVEDSTL